MYVCMYVGTCVCIYVCMYVCMYVGTCVCIMYVYMYIHMCIYIYIYTPHVYMYVAPGVCVYVCYLYVAVCVYIYIYTLHSCEACLQLSVGTVGMDNCGYRRLIRQDKHLKRQERQIGALISLRTCI